VKGRFRGQGTGTLLVGAGDRWHGTMGTFPVRGLSAKGRLDADGSLADVVVADLDIEESIAHLRSETPGVDPELARTTLVGLSDLDRDAEGVCQSVSAAFLAEARTD